MKVFLGGTCNGSDWREELIPLLKINYFDPVVDDWNQEAQERERYEREHSDFCLYVFTPEMLGTYAIAEVVDDSNKKPHKTIFCALRERDGISFTHSQWQSLIQVGLLVSRNGGVSLCSLRDVANYLNMAK